MKHKMSQNWLKLFKQNSYYEGIWNTLCPSAISIAHYSFHHLNEKDFCPNFQNLRINIQNDCAF